MNSPPLVAFIYADSAAVESMRRMVASEKMRSEAYSSIDDFLASGRLDEVDCVVVDAALIGEEDETVPFADSQHASVPEEEKRSLRRVPIIVLSSTDNPKARQQALRFGAAAFFHEPLDGEALLDAIQWELSRNLSK